MRFSRFRIGLTLLVCGFLASSLTAAELRKIPYSDPLHGFSLRPPEDTEQRREFSPTMLVSWVKRDPKTEATVWTLGVQRVVEKNEDIDLKDYARELRDKLQQGQSFKVDRLATGTVVRKPAIIIEGRKGTGLVFWQKQVWILTEKRRFLILTITGAKDMEKKMDSVFGSVLGTLKVHDRISALEARKSYIAAGGKLLESLTLKKLGDSLVTDRQWFVWTFRGKPVGWMAREELTVRRDGKTGVEVRTYTEINMPEAPARAVRQIMWSTADRKRTEWQIRAQVGSGRNARTEVQAGTKLNEMIVCSVVSGDDQKVLKKPQVPEKIYLPRAMAELLPRLVDLNKTGKYIFAHYSPEINRFDMRTVAVQGGDRVEVNGQVRSAVRLSDQRAADIDPVLLWVDKEGKLLKMEVGGGVALEAADRANIMKSYSGAMKNLSSMKDWKTD
ncbi:MAG: hypothetical protein ACLFVU_14860 [Phycisphaerae bacterium]